MKIQITILVDNEAAPGLIREHGLSLWIRVDNKHILFDTGQGTALEINARSKGIDLQKTDILILSHGHYDHTGGISCVLRQSPMVKVYCHPGIVQMRYSIRDHKPKPVSIPAGSISALESLPRNQIHWLTQPVWISDEFGITGPVPRNTSFEDTGGPFYLDPEGKIPDPIEDDIALWIRTDTGLIVCMGCCHAGFVNTLRYVRSLNMDMRIRAVIGGFHLLNADRRRIDNTMAEIQSLNPDQIIPCHCTGNNAMTILGNTMGERVSKGTAGNMYSF